MQAIANSKIWNYASLSRLQKIISQKQDPSRVGGDNYANFSQILNIFEEKPFQN